MNILGVVGSRRKDGHTTTLVRKVLDEASVRAPNISAELLHIAGQTIEPCRVLCSKHCTTHPYQCAISDDVAGLLERMAAADALVIGTPLYFRAPPAGFHALMERLISMAFYQETQGSGDVRSPLADKPCGLVAVAEYSNPHGMLEYLHDVCTLLQMTPKRLDRFPYLGVGVHGDPDTDDVFHPYERAADLATALLGDLPSIR